MVDFLLPPRDKHLLRYNLKTSEIKLYLVIDLDPNVITLKAIQRTVDDWISQFEEGYWPPLSMFAALVEETGELARELNDREGYKKKRAPDNTNLGLELADLLFSLACIANYYHIDLEVAFKGVLSKYTKRDMNRWTKKRIDTG